MNEVMRVSKVNGNKVFLEPLSLEGCSSCPFSATCQVDPSRNKVIVESGGMRLAIGDIVEVRTPKAVATRLSFFVYTIPLLIFISLLVVFKSMGFSDEISFVFSIIPVAFYYVFLRNLDKKLANKYRPKIVKVRERFNIK
jgi:positive regulator of sigma E activity